MGTLTTVDLPPTPDSAAVKQRAGDILRWAVDYQAFRLHHTLHAGVYTRTAYLPKGAQILGAEIKVPTTLIVSGSCMVNVGDAEAHLTGYSVLTAASGRRQFFLALSDLTMTMIVRTDATTVEEVEQEFTDEWQELAHTPADTHNITGVRP